MSKWFKIGVVALLAIGALGALVSGVAFAQETTTSTQEVTGPTQLDRGPKGFGRGLGSQAALEAAAEALGMTVDDLKLQLWGGKTLADLADEKGVDLADVKAAVEAAQKEEVRARIEQAVTDGTITQENADWLLEGLNKGYLGSLKYFGGGHGGRGGHGFGVAPDASTNTTAPSTSTTP